LELLLSMHRLIAIDLLQMKVAFMCLQVILLNSDELSPFLLFTTLF